MRKGFTLTEVLVVIAILAILAAFIFPVMTTAKASAQKTGCVSNLHQLYVAMQLYKNDNGEYPPDGSNNALNSPYLGGVKLHCAAQVDHQVDGDYILAGGDPGQFFGRIRGQEARGKRLAEEWESCRNIRQGELPLVIDINHATELSAYEFGSAFYLVAREAGQVDRVPGEVMENFAVGRVKPPCSLDLGASNL